MPPPRNCVAAGLCRSDAAPATINNRWLHGSRRGQGGTPTEGTEPFHRPVKLQKQQRKHWSNKRVQQLHLPMQTSSIPLCSGQEYSLKRICCACGVHSKVDLYFTVCQVHRVTQELVWLPYPYLITGRGNEHRHSVWDWFMKTKHAERYKQVGNSAQDTEKTGVGGGVGGLCSSMISLSAEHFQKELQNDNSISALCLFSKAHVPPTGWWSSHGHGHRPDD